MTDVRSLTDAMVRGLGGGVSLRSEIREGVRYRLERRIGEGAMAVTFSAIREAPDGVAPVVIKMIRPTVVEGDPAAAELLLRKEVVALGRLNERVPPTP